MKKFFSMAVVVSVTMLFFAGQARAISLEVYVVERGKTFTDAAGYFGVTVRDLRSMNPHIKNIDVIQPGDEIYCFYTSEDFDYTEHERSDALLWCRKMEDELSKKNPCRSMFSDYYMRIKNRRIVPNGHEMPGFLPVSAVKNMALQWRKFEFRDFTGE